MLYKVGQRNFTSCTYNSSLPHKTIYYIENINDVAFLTMTKDRFKIYIILAKSFSFIHVKNFITLHYCKLIHINTDEQIIVKFPKTQTPKLPSNITAHRQSRDNSLISYFPLTFNKKKKVQKIVI